MNPKLILLGETVRLCHVCIVDLQGPTDPAIKDRIVGPPAYLCVNGDIVSFVEFWTNKIVSNIVRLSYVADPFRHIAYRASYPPTIS